MKTVLLSLRLESVLLRLRGRELWPLGLLTLIFRGHHRCLEVSTHLTIAERVLLYRLILQLPVQPRCLEIGSYLGASAAVLAAAARERGGHVWCVDPWTNESMTEGLRGTYQEFLHNTAAFRDSITPVRCYSSEAATAVSGSFDVVFIDGSHEYDSVREDVELWMPRLNPGGWLVLHDTGWAEGVQRVLKEQVLPVAIGDPVVLPNCYATRVRTPP